MSQEKVMVTRTLAIAVLALGLIAGPQRAGAEEGASGAARRPAQIQWFGTWKRAQTEAQRTGRPILLTSAAPECGGVPGMW